MTPPHTSEHDDQFGSRDGLTFRQIAGWTSPSLPERQFHGSQGLLRKKPTVQEHPSHVGPWFTRRPLGRRFLFAVCASSNLFAQGGTREVTDRHNSDHTVALHHREVPEVSAQHGFQG